VKTSRVLVIGIDGTRLDFLEAEPTPNIDRVIGEGFLAPVRIEDDTPTVSGPCWATAVTGTTIDRHNIGSNDFMSTSPRTSTRRWGSSRGSCWTARPSPRSCEGP
jgi:predicted AlkP superfamily pyrophosphatase or phosphodiesterase